MAKMAKHSRRTLLSIGEALSSMGVQARTFATFAEQTPNTPLRPFHAELQPLVEKPPSSPLVFPDISTNHRTGAFSAVSQTEGAWGYPHVNARYQPDEHKPVQDLPDRVPPMGASPMHWETEWTDTDIQTATEENVMLTWGPSGPAKDLPNIVRGEGVYLYDDKGNKYLDWTSQAICVNLGHSVPQEVVQAVAKQMESLPYIYGGMGICPVRSRLSKLMCEITPGDINGFLFPSGGAEANEAAIRIARRYTGRQKILTQYRSYHGGAAATLGATGDFRRFFTEQNVTGFVKIFNPQPLGFSWGKTDDEANKLCLQALEEQILQEGPGSIAAIMLESIVGAGGVLVPPAGYMQGVRALCDKYDILFILDEVMTGFGRTGEVFAFEHFEGVVPDIVTSAKGLTGAYMPMSLVGVREKIKQFFHEQPLGWGATYQAHPVAMACAYECVKYTLQQRLPQRAKALQSVMMEEINAIVAKHSSVKQGRAIGLFGCLDLQQPDGKMIQPLSGPSPPHVTEFRQTLREHGLMSLFRPPLLHCCPPLVIKESELRDGFQRLSAALTKLDESQARLTM
jgi:adenosylmethionine-8-amino-7-oxononanoate aminotransferase